MMKKLNALRHYWNQRHWRAMHKQACACDESIASAMDAVPEALRDFWTRHGPAEFPGMPITDKAWAWSLRGLLTYFSIAASTTQQTLLPSRAADSVWHAWLAWDAEHLRRFQLRYFNKELPHVAKEDMPTGPSMDTAIPRTWGLASAAEGLPILSGHVPFVFAVDNVLDMPTGWAYRHNTARHAVEVADIRPNGLSGLRPVESLTAAAFLGLGMLSATEAEVWQKKNLEGSGSTGSSCGVGMPAYSCGSSSSCDGGDGGCSSGGGDGGSCGGGCG